METKTLLLTILLISFQISVIAQVPVDAQHQYSDILFYSTPNETQYGQVWFQAVTLQNNSIKNNGYISVDYIKLIEEDIDKGTETTLDIDNYDNNGPLSMDEGGLYDRFPWYFQDNQKSLTNSNRANGFLRIDVGQEPDKVIHFWGKRIHCAIGKRHKVEIKVKIFGDIALQAGMDYWLNLDTKNPKEHNEAFYSHWYGDTDGRDTIIKYPDYQNEAKFDRTDYGFTKDGKFYLSKNIVDFVKGKNVMLYASESTNWEERKMTLNGLYYEYQTNTNFESDYLLKYCYNMNPDGNPFYVPHAIMNNLVYPSDVIQIGNGYNFYTRPEFTLDASTLENPLDLFLFPNPANSTINIRNIDSILSIQIYDLFGKLLIKKQANYIKEIDVSQLNSGIYIIKLVTLKEEYIRKISKI